MMRYLLLLAALLCFACGNGRPANVLPPENMRDLLHDIARADELVDLQSITDSTYRAATKRYALYDSVFRIHGVSKVQYNQSLTWYQSRPDELKPLLESVRDKTDTAKKAKPPINSKPLQRL